MKLVKANFLPLVGGVLSGPPILENAVYLQGKDIGGTAHNIVGVSLGNHVELGAVLQQTKILYNTVLLAWNGANQDEVWTGFTHPKQRMAVKAADETVNNSAVLQNDDELLIAVEASRNYSVLLVMKYNTGLTPDLKIAFAVPTGATISGVFVEVTGTSTVSTRGNLDIAANAVELNGHANDGLIFLFAHLIVGVTAGNLQLQWAQNTADVSNSIVRAGSILTIERGANV